MKRDLAVVLGLTMIMGSLAGGCWRERDPDRFEVHERRKREEIREHERERNDDGDRHRDHERHEDDRH